MVHVALTLASLLVLPALSASGGVHAAPLRPPTIVTQQAELHVAQDVDASLLSPKGDVPMAYLKYKYSRQHVRSAKFGKRHHERIVWDEDGLQPHRPLPKPDDVNEGRPATALFPALLQQRRSLRAASKPGHKLVLPPRADVHVTTHEGHHDSPARPQHVGIGVHAGDKRDGALLAGVPGVISVVVASVNITVNATASAVQPLANLIFAADANSTASPVLKASASTMNHTTVYLVPAPAPNTTDAPPSASDDVLVNLKMAVFDALAASLVEYCATYDPHPANASAITAQPCGAPADNHTSQMFTFIPASGAIHPLWDPRAGNSSSPTPANSTALFANSSMATSNSSDANATSSAPVSCHPFSHYIIPALGSTLNTFSTSAAAAAAPAPDLMDGSEPLPADADAPSSPSPPADQTMFELIFVPDLAEFPVQPPPEPAAPAVVEQFVDASRSSTLTAASSSSSSSPSPSSTASASTSSSSPTMTGTVRAYTPTASPHRAYTPTASPHRTRPHSSAPTPDDDGAAQEVDASPDDDGCDGSCEDDDDDPSPVITLDAPAPSSTSSTSSPAPSPSDRK